MSSFFQPRSTIYQPFVKNELNTKKLRNNCHKKLTYRIWINISIGKIQKTNNILFFYKSNFIRRKALIFEKKLRTSWEQSQAYCPTEHKNKALRLVILKIIRTKHQSRARLSLILYCMKPQGINDNVLPSTLPKLSFLIITSRLVSLFLTDFAKNEH